MSAVWDRIVGVLIVAAALLVVVALAVSAMAEGDDFDDDAHKGE